MADTYECILCHKKRPGRFTRPVGSKALTHGKGSKPALPHWYCYTCLPQGEGRDEEDEMKSTGVIDINPRVLDKAKDEGLALVNPVMRQLDTFKVEDAESYLEADNLLGRIRGARKSWGLIWQRIQDTIIKPQREILENTYQINRDVDGPLEKAETKLKFEMKVYKDQEQRLLRAAEREREEEAQRLEEEIRRKTEQAQKATTPQMRGRLKQQAERLKEEQADIIIGPMQAEVMGANSTTRKMKVAKVNNFPLFFAALSEGDILVDNSLVNDIHAFLERMKKAGENVAAYPGCEVVEENQIVGRR